MSADTSASTSPDGLKGKGVHIITPTLDLQLAPGTIYMTTNELREFMDHKFIINLGIGNPPDEAFPTDEEAREYKDFEREKYGRKEGDYGTTQGEIGLREAIAMDYAQQGVFVDPTHIVVVNGAQEALEILSEILVTPNQSQIITTDPTYVGFLQPNKPHNPEYVTYDPQDEDSLEDALKDNDNVAMVYGQPTLHNPLTTTETAEQRNHTADVIVTAKKLYVEDDPYGALYTGTGDIKPVYARAPDNTALVGTMSKKLKPALRVGWVVVTNDKLRDEIIQYKQGHNLCTSKEDQAESEAFLRSPRKNERLARNRRLYEERGEKAIIAARKHLPAVWTQNLRFDGGMFLTFRRAEPLKRTKRKTGVKTRDIAEQAKQLGLAVVPLEIFSTTRRAQGLRTNVIYNGSDITEEGFVILGQILERVEDQIS